MIFFDLFSIRLRGGRVMRMRQPRLFFSKRICEMHTAPVPYVIHSISINISDSLKVMRL